MYLICIAGHSSSGKTTASKLFLEKLSNAVSICVDDFLHSSVLYYKTEFERIFHIPVFSDDYMEVFIEASFKGTAPQWREYFNLILPFVEKELVKTLNIQSSLNKKFAIIDWLELPKLQIWQRANYRIIINSPKNIRHKILVTKMSEMHKIRKDFVPHDSFDTIIRDRNKIFTETIENAVNVDSIIINNYNELFNNEVKNLCDKITKKCQT